MIKWKIPYFENFLNEISEETETQKENKELKLVIKDFNLKIVSDKNLKSILKAII